MADYSESEEPPKDTAQQESEIETACAKAGEGRGEREREKKESEEHAGATCEGTSKDGTEQEGGGGDVGVEKRRAGST